MKLLFLQVKLTIERLKAGWEDTSREREEFNERKIKNLEEQKDKGVCLILVCFSLVLQCSVVHYVIECVCSFVTYKPCSDIAVCEAEK